MTRLVWFPPPDAAVVEWPPAELEPAGFGFGTPAVDAPGEPLVVARDAHASSRTLVVGRALIQLAAIARAPHDGKRSKPPLPLPLAVASARQALSCLAEAVERAEVDPEIAATPDGGVRIVCRHEGRELVITANPDGGGFQLRRSGPQGQTQGFGLLDDVRVAAKLFVG